MDYSVNLDGSGAWPIVGHAGAVSMLRRAIVQGRLSHAYLFTGQPGVGKHALAMAFAMALNCEASPPPGQAYPDVPCGLCPSCSRIRRGAHPDVVEANLQTQAAAAAESGARKSGPAKELKIEAVRDLLSNVGLRAHSARWKIYIIGDADLLNEEASNGMLKTLEEPPPGTILVLLADDETAVLPTILSRCFLVPLRPLSREAVAENLVSLQGIEPEEARNLAALSAGRFGYALGLLGDRESAARRRSALEESAVLARAPVSERIEAATRYAKRYTEARPDLMVMLDAWEGWWRDILVVKAGTPQLAANADQFASLESAARRTSVRQAWEAINLIQTTRKQLLENVNPRLALEALALGLP